jgi:predicted SprT family Zn-dependent metalloprotease
MNLIEAEVLTELNSREDVLDTILHEIAHALVGPGHDHDVFWQIRARSVGAKPIRCYGAEIVEPAPKYIGTCEGCGKEVKRYKLTKRITRECFHSPCLNAGKEAKMTWRKL